MNKNHFTILTIALIITILLIIVPVSAANYVTTTADGKYSNPYPNRIYGEEFRSPERPWASGFGIGECYGDASLGTDSEFSWTFIICFTTGQNELFREWMYDRWDTPLIDVLTELVPEQVEALPDDLVRYLHDHQYITVGHDPAHELTSWSSNEDDKTWTDPCGTHVPPALVPRAIVPGDDRGVVLWECLGSTYTPEVREHLANLGLATDHESLAPSFSTSVRIGAYIVAFEGNTPTGERMSWTLVHKIDGSWTDAATEEEISYDMHYVLAAFCYATSPDYTPPPLEAVIAAKVPSGLQTSSLMAAVQAKAGTASALPTVSSRSSDAFENTLLSQAGNSKVSEVSAMNTGSFARNKATTTPAVSTASLNSQNSVPSIDESPVSGSFDMVSLAASYRTGGTAIASKGFGSDVLAARGIGG